MGKLSTDARKALPKSDFGLPGKRAYPMPDASHAANAKARASQQEAAGNLSPSGKAQIDAKADRVLSKHTVSAGNQPRQMHSVVERHAPTGYKKDPLDK